MDEELSWTKKIKLSKTIRDPLQLAVFRFPDQYFLTGITTQTRRIRYYTFVTWAWNKIKEKKSDLEENRILDLEKILSLVSAKHHLVKNKSPDTPTGIGNIINAEKFMEEFENKPVKQFNVDEFANKNFGLNGIGYGNLWYRGPLADLKIFRKDDDGEFIISQAGKDISTIFSEHIGKTEEEIWSKTVQPDELSDSLCICDVLRSPEEQNFWKHVFFGLTTLKEDSIEINHEEQLKIVDPDKLSFKKFSTIEEYSLEIPEDEDDDFEIVDLKFESQDDFENTSEMRKGTLLMLLEIIKNSKPSNNKKELLQTIRDCIYYSEFLDNDIPTSMKFNKLEPYTKPWEVYVHNLYYSTIFEKTLSMILDISKQKATGIEIDDLVSRIDSGEFLAHIKKFGLQISKSDNVQTAYEKLKDVLGNSRTSLSSQINEHEILEMIHKTDDNTEAVGLIFILFLLCKYRYSSFNKKQLDILSYKQESIKIENIHPETIYEKWNDISVEGFPEQLFKFVIMRHRSVVQKKFYSNNTKAWLFTVEENFLYFNQDYEFGLYRDGKWLRVLDIMNDLGLIKNNSDKKNWEITKEGERWLMKIQ